MNKRALSIITKVNFIFTCSVILLYALIRINIRFFLNYPKGDEFSFLNAFEIFLNDGYWASVSKGSSVLFNLINYLISFFSSNSLYTLRFTSLIFGVLTILLIIKSANKNFKLKDEYFLVVLATVINAFVVSSVMFSGINDTIVYFLTVLIISRLFEVYEKGYSLKKDSVIIALILSAMVLTRLMALVLFIPVIISFGYLFYVKKVTYSKLYKRILLVGAISIVVVFTFNIPSLIEGNRLSFHKKVLDKEVNWSQLQYLTALENDKENVKYGTHVKVDEVKDYIKKNGENSLPKTLFKSLTFNPYFTIKEFFKDFVLQYKPITRDFGLLLLILFYILIFGRKELLRDIKSQIVLLFGFVFISTLSFIVISYVEPRWYIAVVSMMVIGGFSVFKEVMLTKKRNLLFSFFIINLQFCSLSIMNLPYIFKNINVLL